MEKMVYMNNLYDYYKALFTKKQQEYFEDYYQRNFSLSEIAENNNVSRNAVFNQIKIVEVKLEELESTLGLYSKKNKIMKILKNNISDEMLNEIDNLL